MKPIVHKLIARNWARFLGLAALCATAAQAQFVSTAITNLSSPNGLTVDPSGNVYITDAGSNCIAKFVPATGALSVLAGLPGIPGTNNGSGSTARFNDPSGIVYAPSLGGLVVADQANQELRLVTLGGAVSTLAGAPGVYGSADGAAAIAQFTFPSGLALDSTGTNLYIADSGDNAIRLLTTGNLMVTTIRITNGYSFKYPEGVGMDASGNLWVADTQNDLITVISNIASSTFQSATNVAGIRRSPGANDDPVASNAQFDLPSGVFWDGQAGGGGLIIADTGNNTIRSLYMSNGVWSVQTLAGTAGAPPALLDGVPASALFFQPVQIAADVYDSGFYIVDRGNNAVRDLQPNPPQPPLPDPVFGYITRDMNGGTVFNPSSGAVFNDLSKPVAFQADTGVSTYIIQGPTPTDPLDTSLSTNSGTQMTPAPVNGTLGPVLSIVNPPIPDVTMYAVSQAPGRKPSNKVKARFQFITANPVITGNNAADLQITDSTPGASIYYTLDNLTPTNDPASTNSFLVPTNGVLSLNLTSNVTLTARAFAPNFGPSGTVTIALTLGNFHANQLTFGFQSGEASSSFVAAAGQRFVAPVTLTLLPGARMYSLQFNATITNIAPAPSPGITFDFKSMLMTHDPAHPQLFIPILPEMFADPGLTNGMFTNSSINLLGVGWLERYSETNLYDTLAQDLITYSLAKDDLFLSSAGRVIVGGYSFVIPSNAMAGQVYQIQLARPSASADGIGVIPTQVVAPTDGSLTNGAINAIKNVVVGSARYLVGDVNNFRWFNAGDFGDGNLDNSDVEEVFQTAMYGLNAPPFPSDMWDAMDSSNSRTNVTPGLWGAIFSGTNASANAVIDSMKFGDGFLDLSDVYVTYRRSLDPTLAWYVRYWSNGVLNAQSTSNAPSVNSMRSAPVKTGVSTPHTIAVAADQVIASGSTVTVPLRVLSPDPNGLPIRALMFDLQAESLDGSPAITTPISFTPGAGLGSPFSTLSQEPGDLAAVWLDTTVAGIAGNNIIGTVTISLPTGITANSAYRLHITNFSASPNGLAIFQSTLQDGLVTLSDRSASSWGDGIPDSWRLLHFGTISDPASAANADPDGDGASNWQEYIAGTDPLNPASVFKLQAVAGAGSPSFSLQWPSVAGKRYTLQSSTSATPGSWVNVLTSAPGTGSAMTWSDGGAIQAKFFRALVQ